MVHSTRMVRHLRAVLVVVLAAVAILGLASSVPAASAPAAAGTAPTPAVIPDSGQTVAGLDAHDGMISQVGSTYYLYGTRYGCGFRWLDPNSNFCGFGVWSSTDKIHWTDLGNLFDENGWNSWRQESWPDMCVRHVTTWSGPV